MSNVIEVIQQPAPVVEVVQQPAMVIEVDMPVGVSSVDAPLTYDPVTQRLGFNAGQVTGLPPSATTGTAVVDADPRLSNARAPTAHKASHATGGTDALTASDIGAEPAGTAAAGMASHLAASDPHPQYTTAAEAAAAAPVQSVAGKTGAVTLTPADAGADPAGTAATAVAAHVAAADPHTQYTTAARVRDVVLTGLSTATNAAIAAADSILAAFGKLQAQINAHFGAGGAAHADATTSTAGFMAAADKTKLDGIATGATANASDVQLRDRATHSGTQAISTVNGLQTALDGKEAAGTASASMTAHLAAADPHSQYTTTAEAAAAAPVQSVAGKTGAVTLAAADITDSTAAGRTVLTAADAAAQRTALGLAIGTDVQGYDADLQAIGALAGTAGLLRKTAANTWGLDTASYLTGNQTVSISGDATGSGATAITLTLANSGVSAGTYNDSATSVRPFTVDAKGRVTGVGAAVTITPAWSSITSKPTTLAGYGITDAQALDADLTAIAGLSGAAGLLRKTAADTWSLDTASYLTANQSITLSGDASGAGSTAIAVTLANSGVGAGTYRSVTVDVKGRVTAGTNPTTLAGYGISDAQPLDADLTAIAALTHAADNFLVSNGSAWVRETPAEALVSLGLGTPTGTGNVVCATNPSFSASIGVGRFPSDFWTATGQAHQPYGYLGTHGGFAYSWIANGYRNSAGTWTTLSINGSDAAAGIELLTSTGTIVFRSDASKASGSSFTISERMRIDATGAVGIGTTTLTGYGLRVTRPITGSTSSFGVVSDGTIQPDVTTHAQMFRTNTVTAANAGTPYTVASLTHYLAQQGTVHADSSITTQIGFSATSSLTSGTNVYGFYGSVTAATGRWNFYAGGTAQNHFAGNTAIGTTSISARLTVRGEGTTSVANAVLAEDSAGTDLFVVRNDGGFAFKGGTVGLAQTGYTTPANLTTDRTFDANATTLEELADVLGTLIEDLKAKGIIAA